MSTQVLNSSANLSGKTLIAAENADTITGLKTFDRDPSAPFAVTASSAVVTNLDADKVDGKHSTALMLLDGTQAMTGKLDTGSNGQIQFPATQNPSSNVNCLDDYEEGTWTPTIISSGGGAATSTNSGVYTKVGRKVTFQGRVILTSKGTLAAGTITFGGLPFTSSANYFPCTVGSFAALTTAVTFITGLVIASTTTMDIRYVAAASTAVSQLTVADLSNTTDLIFSGFYYV
jgi:hypothetical protein